MTREESFEAEALPHLRALYGTAYRMTRNAYDAEDLVQETYLRAFRAFDRYQPGTNIRAWLFTILHRARTDSFRRQSRSPKTVELTGEGPSVPPPQDALAAGGEDIVRAMEGCRRCSAPRSSSATWRTSPTTKSRESSRCRWER